MAARHLAVHLLAGLCVGAFSSPAFSEDSAALPEWILSAGVPLLAHSGESRPTWDITALMAAQASPRYPGGHSVQTKAFPLIDIRYKDLAFISAIEGLGVNIWQSPSYRLGVALTYDPGRSEHDAPILKNLGSIKPAAEAKIFADYVIFPVVLRADVRRAIDGYPGFIADGSAYVPLFVSDHLVVFSGASLTWASRSFMNAYFGISPTQAIASGLPAYQTTGGLRSAGLGSDITWTLSPHWLLNAAFGAQRFSNRAYHSPLAQTRFETAASIAFGYSF